MTFGIRNWNIKNNHKTLFCSKVIVTISDNQCNSKPEFGLRDTSSLILVRIRCKVDSSIFEEGIYFIFPQSVDVTNLLHGSRLRNMWIRGHWAQFWGQIWPPRLFGGHHGLKSIVPCSRAQGQDSRTFIQPCTVLIWKVKTRLCECDVSHGACFPSPSGALTHLSLYLSDGYCMWFLHDGTG